MIDLIEIQIKLLFQTGFDEAELKSYIPVVYANVYQTIKVRILGNGVLVVSLFYNIKRVASC